jgi:outer membrane protein assembly factor BamD
MNRFRRVIDNYQTTTHVPEALERLVECDLGLGLLKEARENAAVLGYNYPGSRWYEEAYTRVSGVAPTGTAPPATASAPPREPAPSGEPPHQARFSGVSGSLF